MKTYIAYHIITDGYDEWAYTYKEALKIYNRFKKENGCARLYVEVRNANPDEDYDPLEEYCRKSFGPYPT